jgi:alpha-beta hydrolase superfamily lysophospholipase
MRAFILAAAAALPTALTAQVRSGAYVARQGDAEVTRETYRFDGHTLKADVDIPSRGLRLETTTEYSARLSPTRYQATVKGSSGAVLQDLDAVFGDSVKWTMRSGGATRNGVNRISRPYATFQNLMFSQLAVALLRYDRAARGTQVVDVWLPEGARVGQLRMRFAGDSGQVEMSGVTLLVKTDANGWLTGVSVPQQRITVERRDRLEPMASAPPQLVPPAAARESALAFPSGDVRLEGTLTVPTSTSGKIPAVVIVSGSGPTDRNGNAIPALNSNTYAQLAWRLAERGIASLRYDKRGLGASRTTADLTTVTLDDFAADAAAATRQLKADARFSRVFIVGHSEGGWLAMRAMATGAPAAGIALLSTPGRKIAEVLHEQLTFQMDSATARQFDELFQRYLAGTDLGRVPPALQPLLLPRNRVFMTSLAAFDPVAEIARVTVPVLIVQGDKDVQVGLQDLQRLRTAKPDARPIAIRDANHLFKTATTRDRLSQLALYTDPSLPIAPGLVEAIAGWVGSVK